ncbi:unnamed protein product [Miscanthus lutarioriparius]|uniref:Uncharacterized protein n=1 Tax=Miscanthus lutarioriparius TaxID=422564 RepID=A0A811SLV0_9POAL|nr:unnamed protein product [Miscanthus lutarioriparius]
MKVKLLFPYAVSCVFGGMGRAWGMAMVGLHIMICIVKVISFTTDPEEARFWIPIFRVWVYLCIAATVVMTCVCIVCYMPVYGVYAMRYDPPPPQPAAAAAVQLPPPPSRDGHVLGLVCACGTTKNWKMLQVLLAINWLGDEKINGRTSVLKRFCFLLPHLPKHR